MTWNKERLGETELLARSRNDDREAFGELIERYAENIVNVIGRIIGNHADAQDIMQETFVSAFRALPGFRADARFSTWLHRIAVNKCKDWFKTHGRKQAQEEPKTENGKDPVSEIPDDRTPEDFLSQKQMAIHLERAIQALPHLYREAFILKHVEGLNYEAMSEIVGVGRDTLKMRVYKARTQLCSELEWLRDQR